jgi:hypothetical protein
MIDHPEGFLMARTGGGAECSLSVAMLFGGEVAEGFSVDLDSWRRFMGLTTV